jgi:cytochrome c-type biogenesis protein CcmF
LFILIFLAIVVGGSLTLYAFRAPAIQSEVGFAPMSRETFLLANSLIFVLACLLVLLGTLFPLMADALNLGKYSVGEPWFNLYFPKFMAVAALLLGMGVMSNWKRAQYARICRWQACACVISLWFALAVPVLFDGPYSISAAVAVFAGSWVICASCIDYLRKNYTATARKFRFKSLGLSYTGMMIAHIGFGVCLLGASIDSMYADERDLRATIGSKFEVSGYEFELMDVAPFRGPNYVADRGDVIVKRDGDSVARLYPEKRRYFSGGNIMTEADIDAGLFRDLYVSLGDKINNTDWALRVYFKPLVRWVWFGAGLMALGGALAVMDKRYRRVRVKGERTETITADTNQVVNEV